MFGMPSDMPQEEPAKPKREVYLAEPMLADVLHEQLDYLLEHAISVCGPECLDCRRRALVKQWLLQPFLK